ncbi:type II toxin-antitoxin system ribonuclease VapC1 [Kutzneria viridogrisea]|uniref:Ribonuclease VapC n=2 Tax=Kutzneria TaxID=43356 RepID=W5WK18_9PSEU|nr:type II toxin-antitoxin system VapC family toxin [Kutzneria albida]AHI00922.1 hypothetical protein KALB_7564 [Kutzneria albida DSM 43870]MBA8926199.1 putative nucleic acid-binding protein [Kutzneria viridogrisea]
MNDLVVDASVYIYASTSTEPRARQLLDRIRTATCHAPHLFDAEVGNVLRRKELAGQITANVALVSLRAVKHLISERYPAVGPLAEAAWRLRGAVTFYDALYVVLAASLGSPLVTGDARLSRAPGLPCQVELV